jgi:DNA ligase-1
MDGIRCLFINGQMVSRSFKPIRNKVLQEKFKGLKEYSAKFKHILDGELYMPGASFQDITSWVMTENKAVPADFKFYWFDCVVGGDFPDILMPFEKRIDLVPIGDVLVKVEQKKLYIPDDVQTMFEEALSNGYEGLILKSPSSHYKNGRATINEGLMYKVKPFETFDGEIVEVIQSTEAREGSEKSLDNFGYSKTSKKKDDRVLIEKASAFRVKYNGTTVKVTLAMSDEDKETVWEHRDAYIGKWIEYKGMQIGAKDVPRHPVFVRFRVDKDPVLTEEK